MRAEEKALLHIGHTVDLAKRVRMLRATILSDEPPKDDLRIASLCLGRHRLETDSDQKISVLPLATSRAELNAIYHFLHWQYRIEKGSSPLCDFGRFRVEPKGASAGDRNTDSHPPLHPSGSIESQRWMGLDWSEWEEPSLGSIQRIPTQPGIYRIYDHEAQEMLYLGESSDLRRRIRGLSRHGRDNALFSFLALPRSMPDYKRKEIENDLIGGYYMERVRPPRFQFGKR